MSINNKYKPAKIKLDTRNKIIWLFSMVACGIYSIIVFLILLSSQIPASVKLITIYSYMVIMPLAIFLLWLLLYIWKIKRWPLSEKVVFGRNKYLLMSFLMGICVTNFAAYWNTGIMMIWIVTASGVYFFTNNELLTAVIYTVGAIAITPAFVEEFLKSLPSILAFFVVLQRNRDRKQKGKGILGNELNGFLFGIMIGLAFEIVELISYLVMTILSGGNIFDIYTQVAVRSLVPLHIFGGAVGGYAAGRAERLRFERGEENLPMKNQIINFLKRFIPFWLIPVSIHFLWNSSSVWIFLYVYSINAQNTDLFIILQLIVLSVLGSLIYVLLLIFLRQANKVAKKTYRCPETGIIVANENIVCTSFSDRSSSQNTQFSQKRPAKFCTRCGKPIKIGARFCVNCGFTIKQFNLAPVPQKLYNKYAIIIFVFTLVISIIFLVFSLLIFVLSLLEYGSLALILLFTQTGVELLTIGFIIYAIIILLKIRKNYDGRKSIWGWMILIFNLIG
ncbi:MAG: PrsW family glutamic-type intramembrane protease, partial [Promethearchaeota archaeon]